MSDNATLEERMARWEADAERILLEMRNEQPWTTAHFALELGRAHKAAAARLTAINADLCAANLRHAEAIAAEQPPAPPDGWRAGAEAMRRACLNVSDKIADGQERPPMGDWSVTAAAISHAIRALPIPSPPAEETKT